MPADLVPQIPLVRRLLEVMGIPCLELAGYEADDVLATLATRTVAAGGECTIATSDKDARQLLGDRVRLLNLRNNAGFGAAELEAEWGIRPDQVVDFLALVGDSVDNVPGVPGIGPKIAGELLRTFDTLDGVLANVDEVSGTKRRENLAAHADTARAGRELIRLETGRAAGDSLGGGPSSTQPDPEALAAFLREMGFRSLLAKSRRAEPRRHGLPGRSPRPPATLFDMSTTADEPAAAPAAVDAARPGRAAEDAAAAAAVVDRLRRRGSADVVCRVATRAATPMTPPLGLAVAGDGLVGWFARASSPAAQPLRALLAERRVAKQGHDLKRQDVALRTLGHPARRQAFDTLLAAYLLEAGERNLGLGRNLPPAWAGGLVPAEPAAAAGDRAAGRRRGGRGPLPRRWRPSAGSLPPQLDGGRPRAAVPPRSRLPLAGHPRGDGVSRRAGRHRRAGDALERLRRAAGRARGGGPCTWPATPSRSPRRCRCGRCCSTSSACRSSSGPRPARAPTPRCSRSWPRSTRCRRSCWSTASTPSSRAPTSMPCRRSSIPARAGSTPPSTRPSPPPGG